jgi:hypothetical protein
VKNTILGLLAFSASAYSATILAGNYGAGSIEQYSITGTDLGAFVAAGSGGLSAPGGFSVGPDGNLYVASRGTGSILEYNGTSGAFIGTFSTPTGEGTPYDIMFGSNGNAYVSSQDGFYILNGTTGAVLSGITGGTGSGNYGEAFRPSNGDFLLSEFGGGIIEYTLSGVLVGTYGTVTSGADNVGLAVGADGRVYSANQNNGTIGVIPLAGGAESNFATNFSAPEYLALFGGNLYFTDYFGSKVYALDGSGNVVSSFSTSFSPYGMAILGASAAVPEPGSLSLLGAGLALCGLLGRRALR